MENRISMNSSQLSQFDNFSEKPHESDKFDFLLQKPDMKIVMSLRVNQKSLNILKEKA